MTEEMCIKCGKDRTWFLSKYCFSFKSNGFGGRVTKIGNLIKDDWLDFDTFFKEETDE
ncbi:hypothetical protein [Streptococcus suis]|uniref:hypothetical protein n=1 Tax=Streptococcus suis TaxID=1307 RepID=UPI00301009F0